MSFSTFSWVGSRAIQWVEQVRCLASEWGLPVASCKAEEAAGRAQSREKALGQLPAGQVWAWLRHSAHWQKRATHPVVGVEVPNVKAAYLELQAAGVTFVTGVMEWGDGNASAYFRGPDQHLYEIWQRSTPEATAQSLLM